MKNVKIVNVSGLNTVNYVDGREGKFRMISKCKAGYVTCSNAREFENIQLNKSKAGILSGYKKGALQTVEFSPNNSEGSEYWLTIFARVGKKIKVIDESILMELEVGVINQLWDTTELYNQNQYKAVNSKTWADKAYVMNETVNEDLTIS